MKTVDQKRRPRVVFRFDSSKEMGIGHAMRCLTLAEELRNQGAEVVAVSRLMIDVVQLRAEALGIPIHLLNMNANESDDAETITSLNPNFAVIDGYHFSNVFFEHLALRRIRVAIIDDSGENGQVECLMLINPNPYAKKSMCFSGGNRIVLAGPQYTLIRSDIRGIRRRRTVLDSDERQILVSIGGTDSLNLSTHIRGCLEEFEGCSLVFSSTCNTFSSVRSSTDLVEEFGVIDLAIVGAGSTLWECLYLGIPTIGIVVADNQANAAEYLVSGGYGLVVDFRDTTDIEMNLIKLQEAVKLWMDFGQAHEICMSGIDGLGAERVAASILEEC